MKKGYWVVAYKSISDDSAVKAYGALAVPAVQSFGGRFLTRSTSQVQVHEADYSSGLSLLNSIAMTSLWRLTKARLTKRRWRHSPRERNATTASLKVHRFKRHVISAGRPAFNKPGYRIK
jgi:Domain of unknown function (DUF1330)